MIDAFYQSLVCFFIPYFVSLVLISISSSSLRNSLLLLLSYHFRSFGPSSRSSFSSPPQAYADSDVDLFTWGTPITTLALLTILVHLGIETKTWVRNLILDPLMSILKDFFTSQRCFFSLKSAWLCESTGVKAGYLTPAD